jgi:pimeloyl-ACP methyl ester carboxylesterase
MVEAQRILAEATALMTTDPAASVRLSLPLNFPQKWLDAHPEIYPLMEFALKAAPTKRTPPIPGPEEEPFNGWKTAPRLHELTMPVLVIHGTEDRLIDVSHAHRLFEGLPDAELRIIKGAGHGFQAKDPEGIDNGISTWLRAREVART